MRHLTASDRLVTESCGFNDVIRSSSNRIDEKAFLREKPKQWQSTLKLEQMSI